MPKLLANFRILETFWSKRCQYYGRNGKIICRKLISQETPGVYSFGPDLNSSDVTQVIERCDNGPRDAVISTFGYINLKSPQNSYYERPTPIIFVSGEALGADIWFLTANYFSQRGFSGLLLSLPNDSDLSNIDNAADYLEKKRFDFGLIPPIIVAHSISSFIAQKYLESYSLKGLVLINPVPPVHTETVRNLLENEKYCKLNTNNLQHISTNAIEENNLLSTFSQLYYNIKDPIKFNLDTHIYQKKNFPINFMTNLVTDEDAPLRLEKGVVPLLIVSTTGDRNSDLDSNIDGTRKSLSILKEESLYSIADFHGIDRNQIVILQSDSRAPMLDLKTADEFNQIIYDWIDDL